MIINDFKRDGLRALYNIMNDSFGSAEENHRNHKNLLE